MRLDTPAPDQGASPRPAADPGPHAGDLADELTTGLTGSLNLRRTVLRLLDLLRPAIADWAMLTMRAGRSGGLKLYGGDDPAFTATVSSADTEDLGVDRVLRSGRTELQHVDTDRDDDLTGLIPHAGLRAEAAALRRADVLAVPLTARGSTIGVLTLLRRAGFSAADASLAEQVASRAALALDSAQLYEDRNHIASVLQASLRPPSLPEIPGARVAARFRAAAEHLDIGGDFYDVHGHGDDWLLVLGDVCGKGVEAAVLTGRTRQSIRTAAHFDRRPEAVLAALNSVLYATASDEAESDGAESDGAESDRFVTVACARLRQAGDGTAEVDLAVAGHPAPVIVRAGGAVEQVDVSGIAAGVLPDASYRPVGLRLCTGDTLVMFTDGIEEAGGAAGVYGMDRLLALLPGYAGAGADALCEAVEQSVLEYLDGRPHDDIALLALTCGR